MVAPISNSAVKADPAFAKPCANTMIEPLERKTARISPLSVKIIFPAPEDNFMKQFSLERNFCVRRNLGARITC